MKASLSVVHTPVSPPAPKLVGEALIGSAHRAGISYRIDWALVARVQAAKNAEWEREMERSR